MILEGLWNKDSQLWFLPPKKNRQSGEMYKFPSTSGLLKREDYDTLTTSGPRERTIDISSIAFWMNAAPNWLLIQFICRKFSLHKNKTSPVAFKLMINLEVIIILLCSRECRNIEANLIFRFNFRIISGKVEKCLLRTLLFDMTR